jgi:hypothetical protein
MHLPQGIAGWIVFAAGLLIVAYRIHGIDAPRTWIEWVERQFSAIIPMRFVGGGVLAATLILGYFGGKPQFTLIGMLYLFSLALFAFIGLGLLVYQNHLRHFVFASAESSDKMLRFSSIGFVLLGLAMALLPFFY